MAKTETLAHVTITITGVVKVTQAGAEDEEHDVARVEVVGARLMPPDIFSAGSLLPNEVLAVAPLFVVRHALGGMEKLAADADVETEDPQGGATQPPGAA